MPEDNPLTPPSDPISETPAQIAVTPKNILMPLSLALATIALVIAGFSAWQWFNASQATQTKLELVDQLSSISRINSTRLSLLQQQNHRLQAQIQTLSQKNTPAAIVLNESADWVRAAQMSQLMNNTANAIQYLQQADEAVRTLNNPKYQSIRSAINQDLNQLKNLPATDQEGLIIKLDALNQSIMQLPTVFNPKTPKVTPAKATEINPYEAANWKEKLFSSLTYLKDFVVVRHNSQLPILTPEQQDLLKMTIQFKGTETQWAVMQLQDSLYQHNLSFMSDLLQTYFIHSVESTAILNQIKELQQTHLQAHNIAINHSLDAIEDQLKQINSAPLTRSADITTPALAPQTENKTQTPQSPNPVMPPIHHSVEA